MENHTNTHVTYMYVCILTYIYMCACIYVHMYMHIYMYVCMHICMHLFDLVSRAESIHDSA